MIEVWPDAVQAVRVFMAMETQWRHGFAGPTGLDYGSLAEVWERCEVPEADRDAVFEDLRVLELAALAEMHPARN